MVPVIRRERDHVLLNKVANHPDVVGWIRPDGEPTDWAPLFTERASISGVVVLSDGEAACGVFELVDGSDWTAQVFKADTIFAPPVRGQRAVLTAMAMLNWMFDRNVASVWGATPTTNRRALMFNRLIRAERVPDLCDADEDVFVFRRDSWPLRTGTTSANRE